MRGPDIGLLGKRVLVLSRHQTLCEAIKVGLKHLKMNVVEWQAGSDGLDLVVFTLLSSVDASADVPARDVLPKDLGKVPLLLISDRMPGPNSDGSQVFYLRFPFRYEELYAKTAEILNVDLCLARRDGRLDPGQEGEGAV